MHACTIILVTNRMSFFSACCFFLLDFLVSVALYAAAEILLKAECRLPSKLKNPTFSPIFSMVFRIPDAPSLNETTAEATAIWNTYLPTKISFGARFHTN